MAVSEYERLFRKALKVGRDRDYLKASNLLLRIVSETDEIPQAYLYLGRSYHALGNFDLAIQFLKYFADIKPGVGAAHFFLGRAYAARCLFSDAVAELETAASIDSENPQVHALLGLSYLRIRRSDLGSEALGRAVELDTENTELYDAYRNALLVDAVRRYRSGDIVSARGMFTFLHDSDFEGPLPVLYLAALEKTDANYDEALRWYDRAVFFNTEDPLIHLQRAGVLYQLGRTSEAFKIFAAFGLPVEENDDGLDSCDVDRFIAEESFGQNHFRKAILHSKRVIRRQGPDYDMHVLLGEAFRNLQSYTKARNHFTRAHEMSRQRIEPLYGIAMVLWQQEQWKEMMDYLSRVERLAPGDPIAAYYKALCLCKLEQDPARTIPEIQNALRKNETDEYITAALAYEYLKDNRPDLAEKWFRKALDHAPGYQPAHQGLIRTYELLDDDEREIESYQTYLEQFPADLPFRTGYIQLLLSREVFGEATEQIQTALTYRNSNLELTRLLAFCYRKTERYREAAVIYRNLLKEEPTDEDYLRSLCYCLEESGNRKTAVSLLEKAIGFLKPTTELRLIYGVLLFRENNLEKALEQFRSVLDEQSSDWRAYKNIGMIYRKRGIEDFAEKFLAQAEKHRPI